MLFVVKLIELPFEPGDQLIVCSVCTDGRIQSNKLFVKIRWLIRKIGAQFLQGFCITLAQRFQRYTFRWTKSCEITITDWISSWYFCFDLIQFTLGRAPKHFHVAWKIAKTPHPCRCSHSVASAHSKSLDSPCSLYIWTCIAWWSQVIAPGEPNVHLLSPASTQTRTIDSVKGGMGHFWVYYCMNRSRILVISKNKSCFPTLFTGPKHKRWFGNICSVWSCNHHDCNVAIRPIRLQNAMCGVHGLRFEIAD